MEGVFVTGTGTEVGKTVVAGVLARTAAASERKVAVFKPAVSGLDESRAQGVAPDHDHLRRAAGSGQRDEEISPYRFGPALSPHLAAEIEGVEIEVPVLRGGLAQARENADFLVCEGVGGFLVPLRLDYLIRDFAVDAGLPVVVVGSPGLGTINHTLLTLEAVRAAGLALAAVVLTPWPAEPGPLESSNLEAISTLGQAPVLTLERIDVDDPARWPALEL